jgi:hypothetical protein
MKTTQTNLDAMDACFYPTNEAEVMAVVKVGTPVFNRGDVCNQPHHGTVYAVEMPAENTVCVPTMFWIQPNEDEADGYGTDPYCVFWTSFTGSNARLTVC